MRLVRIEHGEPAAATIERAARACITLGNGTRIELIVDTGQWPALLGALATLP